MTTDYNLKIQWVGFPYDNSGHGYAHVAEKMGKAFDEATPAYMVGPFAESWDWMIQVTTPQPWLLGPSGRRPDVCLHTMYEADPLPPGWVQTMNRVGCVWTPSQWSKSLFEAQGVTVPIFVSGYGVDHQMYKYRRREAHEGFRVRVWSETMVSRKNVMRAVFAFQKANLPGATLDIKIRGMFGMDEHTHFNLPGTTEPDPRITIHAGLWEREKLVTWLQEGDVGLYLSGGEGFGLMPLEAMATGLPMICSYNTGMMEYLTEDAALLVPCPTREKSAAYSVGMGGDMWVFKPDLDVAIDMLKWGYNNRHRLYAIGDVGAEVARRFTWESGALRAYSELERLHEER